MKKFTLACLLLAASYYGCTAQNLISNPGFSLHSGCPDYIAESNYCSDWRSATHGTPDYYNSCDQVMAGVDGPAGAPQSIFAYQASNDSAYMGIYGFQIGYREYITTHIPALLPGRKYKVSMLVSRADSVGYASGGYGVYFYKNAIPDSTTTNRIPVVPQVDYTSYGPIYNDTGWSALVDTFIADSAYTDLIIGNFHPDSDTSLMVRVNLTGSGFSYYLIDSVAVEDITGPAGVDDVNYMQKAVVKPNPFSDQCTISFSNSDKSRYTFILYNIMGMAVMKEDDITTSSITILRNNLPAGYYYYKLQEQGDIKMTGKLQIN